MKPDSSFFTTYELGVSHPVLAAVLDYQNASKQIFREDKDIQPQKLGKYEYMPWGVDNQMPYDVIAKVEENTVLRACQRFDAEATYGQGLLYNTEKATAEVKALVEKFKLHNNIPLYYLGVCNDLKQYEFAVTVITISNDCKSIAAVHRCEAVYCRFAPKDKHGQIPYLLYGPWREGRVTDEKDVVRIPVLNSFDPLGDLETRLAIDPVSISQKKKPTGERQFAIVTRMPSIDSTYYPIPSWATLFKDNWYDIYRLISLAKQAKLKNTAPLKYIVTINDGFWEKKFPEVTNDEVLKTKINAYKDEIINFLTGAENSGKAIFAGFYVDPQGHEQPDIKITNLETSKEGGDWETDIQEAINMICFAMGVHSNLVGSVPGKSQSNNSGSDKRELYTIAQARQKSYHDLLFKAHEIIIYYNKWVDVTVECPIIMLTTLDEHQDAKQVNTNQSEKEE